ncbi:MAG: response regulator [Candidatus Omnitrophota bacterium]
MVKVLVVDDEMDFCKSLEEILTREGYQVIVANSGSEAIEKVETERPQLILLDIRMPQMDGLQTLERIRQIDREAVITMVTVVKDTSVEQKTIRLGAVNYITKPLDLDLLKRSLQGWATQIEARQLKDVDILAWEYDPEKLKSILDLFTKKGYNIKCVETKSSGAYEIVKRPDLLVLRADILADDTIEVLSKYKEAYPGLPVLIVLKSECWGELVNKAKTFGACRYLPASFETYGIILVIYKMLSSYREKVQIIEDTKPSDYILIVDDEADLCEYTAKFLARDGYKVYSTTDPRTVLDQVKVLKPSIVLLDIIMPGVNGLELLKKIKMVNPNTQVIMMTGVKDESICRETIKSGACDYLVKPFSLDQLKATVLINSIKAHLN